MSRRRAGFTLIELLVVIAIIAILAAILFPVFAQARAKALQTTCLSNVKQISLAVIMYCSDWDGMFPGVWPHAEIPWCTIPYGDAVMPYVKNLQIFTCPADPYKADRSLVGGTAPCSYGVYGNHFGFINHHGLGCFGDGNINNIIKPAEKYMMGENLFASAHTFFQWWGCSAQGFHAQGINMAYMDGHAKVVRYQSPELEYRCPPCGGSGNLITQAKSVSFLDPANYALGQCGWLSCP